MELEWDEGKRRATFEARGLDFADAEVVLSGPCVTIEDRRQDYGELRRITFGQLAGRVVVLAWTYRGEAVRVISMRKANERETKAYRERLEQG
ncbi:MAG: BrnT family toxin [Deltaproteobacteria bacterium]|nr:BrnT family toxin [Deltaproteobacteria bacterium]